ncbi:hypothetical protein QTP88_020497 [Uroleucon formosanum]
MSMLQLRGSPQQLPWCSGEIFFRLTTVWSKMSFKGDHKKILKLKRVSLLQ